MRVFKLNLKNIDKNMIENIIVIVSAMLVIICFFLIITTSVTTTPNANQVEWDGYMYYIEADETVEINDENTLKITSPYDTHNIELKKTTDQSLFKKYLGSDNISMFSEYPYNDTHMYVSVESGTPYAVIVPNDAIKMDGTHYVIKEGTTFIEVIGKDSMYMSSFTSGHQKVK